MDTILSQRESGTSPHHKLHRGGAHRDGLLSPSTSVTRSLEADEPRDVSSGSPPPLLPLEMAKPGHAHHHLPSPELGEEQTDLLLYSSPDKESSTPSPPPQNEDHGHQEASSPHCPSTSRSPITTKEATRKAKISQTPIATSSSSRATTKMPPSSSSDVLRQPIPIQIQILAPSDRDNHPYTAASVQPTHAFTMRLLPRTSMRELCTHAEHWVRLKGGSSPSAAVAASSSFAENNHKERKQSGASSSRASSATRSTPLLFEARDRNGYVHDVVETVGDALMTGETVFLVRDGGGGGRRSRSRSVGGGKGGKGDATGEDNEGMLLRGLHAESARRSRADVRRTPSVASSSRSRSRSTATSKKARSEPRKTPSQRALEVATRGLASWSSPLGSEPGRGRTRVAGGARRGGGATAEVVRTIEESPSPPPRSASRGQQQGDGAPAGLMKTIENSPSAAEPEQEQGSPTEPAKKDDDDASSGVVASQQTLPSPALSPSLLSQNGDSQLVIPDSQDPPTPATEPQSKPAHSVIPAPQVDEKIARSWKPINSFPSSELATEQRLSQTTTSLTHSHSLGNARTKFAQRPSPASMNDTTESSVLSHEPEVMNPRLSPALRAAKSQAPPTRPSSSAFYDDLGAQRTKPAHKPDPYDVITDDESQSLRRDSFLRSSVRKLGSTNTRPSPTHRAPTAAVERNSLLIARKPPVASRVVDEADAIIPSTPLAVALKRPPPPTPVGQTGPSSPLALMPSSPTDLVAAVLARARPQPQKGYIVIDESDVDADDHEHVLNDAQDRFSSSRGPLSSQSASEAALPWSAPPLRLGLEEDTFWPVRAVGRRAPALGGQRAGQESGGEGDAKADLKKLVELDKKNVAAMVGNGKSNQGSPRNDAPSALTSLGSPMKSQMKSFSHAGPGKSPSSLDQDDVTARAGDNQNSIRGPRLKVELAPLDPLVSPVSPPVKGPTTSGSQATTGKSPVLLVHGSSSSEEGVEEIGWVEPGQKTLPVPREAASPPLNTAATHDTRSQDDNSGHGNQSAQTTERLMDDDVAAELLSTLPEDDGMDLPVIDEPEFAGPASQDDISSQTKPSPPREIPKTDPITATDLNRTPPSAQACKRAHHQVFEESPRASEQKRKRQPSEEPEPEDERSRQKRLRREARQVLKAERRRRLEEEEAQREAERVRLQEERKRVALEQAQMRARKLEIAVSSPLKAAEMELVLTEESGYSDQDEEEDEAGDDPNNSPLNQRHANVGPNQGTSFKGGDNNDSLSSRGGDGRPSWRELSKRHFSASPQSNRDRQVPDRGADAGVRPSGPAVQQIIRQDEPIDAAEAEEEQGGQQEQKQQFQRQQFQRSRFNDWAFLEDPLGRAVYSPLEVHNRIHMEMVRASLQGIGRPDEETGANHSALPETSQVSLNKTQSTKSKRKRKTKRTTAPNPPSRAPADEEETGDNLDTSPRSVRSAAPSPQDMAVAPAQAPKEAGSKQQQQQQQQGQDGVRASKSQTRKKKDNKRKQRLRRKKLEKTDWSMSVARSVRFDKRKK